MSPLIFRNPWFSRTFWMSKKLSVYNSNIYKYITIPILNGQLFKKIVKNLKNQCKNESHHAWNAGWTYQFECSAWDLVCQGVGTHINLKIKKK